MKGNKTIMLLRELHDHVYLAVLNSMSADEIKEQYGRGLCRTLRKVEKYLASIEESKQ